ncbi:MAG: type I restriction enzyme HsdR N-terminal domain-containing protein [Bacteroidota bacterium]
MIALDLTGIELQLKQEAGKTQVFDAIRKKWLVLTPEEHVRQYIVAYLCHSLHYPMGLIAIEKSIKVGDMNKRFDIVVYNRDHEAWMLIECKAPEVMITETTLHQLLNYQRTIQCKYWVLSNGHQTFCADASDIQHIQWLHKLPAYQL